jgi:hypothetical protein
MLVTCWITPAYNKSLLGILPLPIESHSGVELVKNPALNMLLQQLLLRMPMQTPVLLLILEMPMLLPLQMQTPVLLLLLLKMLMLPPLQMQMRMQMYSYLPLVSIKHGLNKKVQIERRDKKDEINYLSFQFLPPYFGPVK